jgi:hypothetical protein
MGEWHHSPHMTVAARRYSEDSRAVVIALFVEQCLPALRDTARSMGYALAVHGTQRRDLDLVAIPWIDKAKSPDELIQALALRTKDLTGWGHLAHDGWTEKPHGRVATTLIADSEVHLDISVMPLVPAPEKPE